MSKSQEIDNPDTEEKTDEMLANVVDTDQVNSEHQTNSCHQFSVSELVKQNSREQPGEKVDNPTKR